MSFAFEVNQSDVLVVLRRNEARVLNSDDATLDELASCAFDELDFDEIERAALSRDDLGEVGG